MSVSHKCVGGAPGVDGQLGTPGTWGSPFYNGNEATDESPIVTDPAPTINDPSGETACSADVRLCTVCDESKTICQQKRDVKGFKASVATKIKTKRLNYFVFRIPPRFSTSKILATCTTHCGPNCLTSCSDPCRNCGFQLISN